MASTLRNVLNFVGVGAGLQATLAHGLNAEGLALIPDKAFGDNGNFDITFVDATSVTVQNNGPNADDVNVLVEWWHSVDRDFVTPGQANLTPQPFVSDGSAGSGGQGGPQIVYQPGGIAVGNIYPTWGEVMTALAALTGVVHIYVDNSIVSPAVIPAGGPYDLTDVILAGMPGQGVPSIINIADGASFTNLLNFENCTVLNLNTVASPCTLANGDRIVIRDAADIGCAVGAVPFYDGSGLLAAQYAVLEVYDFGGIGQYNPNVTIIDMAAAVADTLFVQVGERSHIGNNTIDCNAAGTVQVLTSSTSAFLLEQGGIAGTFQIIRRGYPQFNMRPQFGVVPAIANVAAVERGDWLRLNATAGLFTQDMPEAAHVGVSTELTDGRTFIVTETSGLNGITLDAQGVETVDGAATFPLPPGATMMFISDGVSNWQPVAIDYRAILNRHNTFTRAQGSAAVALVDAANIATDASLSNVFTVTLGGNRQLDNPTNLVAGFTYMWIITQDAGAPRTLTYDTLFDFPGGVAPTLSTGVGDVDVITAVYDGTNLLCVFQADFS